MTFISVSFSQTVDPPIYKIAKKIFLKTFQVEISLQFTVEDLINPLVSLSYLSSEEEMEVDAPHPLSKWKVTTAT